MAEKNIYNEYYHKRNVIPNALHYLKSRVWQYKNKLLGKSPLKVIPPTLKKYFTLNGKIPVIYSYYDDTYSPKTPRVYKTVDLNFLIAGVRKQRVFGYGITDTWLFSALRKYPIKNKKCVVIGSTGPWYESVGIAHGGKVTTLEYNKILSTDKRLSTLTIEEYKKNPLQFDIGISISSFEHDGLGRYGDPINPNGDLDAMKNTKKMIKKRGLLFLAVPVGKDTLVWNAHRIYGKKRLPLLLEGWEVLDTFGFDKKSFERKSGATEYSQPLFVLKNV